MNDISSDESTDKEEINKNFETEVQLIVETDTLPKIIIYWNAHMQLFSYFRPGSKKNSIHYMGRNFSALVV